MTRDEFIAHAAGEAETLRQGDPGRRHRRRPRLLTLAADQRRWRDLFLASLEEAGLLRPEDALPPIREQPKIVSLMATLAPAS